MKVYEAIAQSFDAWSRTEGNPKFNESVARNHEDRIRGLYEYLPHGSGFDSGSSLDFELSKPSKMLKLDRVEHLSGAVHAVIQEGFSHGQLVFETHFHHMDQHGGYSGWSGWRIVVVPAFDGFDLDAICLYDNSEDFYEDEEDPDGEPIKFSLADDSFKDYMLEQFVYALNEEIPEASKPEPEPKKERILRIAHDECPENPRHYMDCLGTMVGLDDGHRAVGDRQVTFEVAEASYKSYLRAGFVAIPFSDVYDGDIIPDEPGAELHHRHIGFIWADPAQAEKVFGTKPEYIVDQLKAELRLYSDWAVGNCFGFQVIELCPCCGSDYDVADSCWGYYGIDLDEMKEFIREHTGDEFTDRQIEDAWMKRYNR